MPAMLAELHEHSIDAGMCGPAVVNVTCTAHGNYDGENYTVKVKMLRGEMLPIENPEIKLELLTKIYIY